MNYQLFDKRLAHFYRCFPTNKERIKALQEVIAETPQGKNYRRSLCKGFSKDAETNEAIADYCDQEIRKLSHYQQLTIFDAIAGGAA